MSTKNPDHTSNNKSDEFDESYLDDLRNLVIKSEQDELANTERTLLLNITTSNPANKSNKKTNKKINPKFCVDWLTLELDMQVNRIIEYVGRYSAENDLPSSTSKKIRKLLVEALVKGTLNEIEWDTTNGMIRNIPKLFFNPHDGYFLGTYLNNQGELATRISKISITEDGNITCDDPIPTLPPPPTTTSPTTTPSTTKPSTTTPPTTTPPTTKPGTISSSTKPPTRSTAKQTRPSTKPSRSTTKSIAPSSTKPIDSTNPIDSTMFTNPTTPSIAVVEIPSIAVQTESITAEKLSISSPQLNSNINDINPPVIKKLIFKKKSVL
ncbi:MAG: hypothetical protein WD512_17755 [Candidatus Paceibacterota bacterium]